MEKSITFMANQVSHNSDLPCINYGVTPFLLNFGRLGRVDRFFCSIFIFSETVPDFGRQDVWVAGGETIKWDRGLLDRVCSN
jgi:hypothetical protein